MARRKKQETILSGTRAMMAASALNKLASKNRELAATLNPAHVARNTIPNLLELASWYDEVAAALILLDGDRLPIVPEPLVASADDPAYTPEEREKNEMASSDVPVIGLDAEGMGQA